MNPKMFYRQRDNKQQQSWLSHSAFLSISINLFHTPVRTRGVQEDGLLAGAAQVLGGNQLDGRGMPREGDAFFVEDITGEGFGDDSAAKVFVGEDKNKGFDSSEAITTNGECVGNNIN